MSKLLRFFLPTQRYGEHAWWIITMSTLALGIVIYGLIAGWSHVLWFAAGWTGWQIVLFVVNYQRRRKAL